MAVAEAAVEQEQESKQRQRQSELALVGEGEEVVGAVEAVGAEGLDVERKGGHQVKYPTRGPVPVLQIPGKPHRFHFLAGRESYKFYNFI